MSILRILPDSSTLQNPFQVLSLVFKALNTLTVRLHSLVLRSTSRQRLFEFLKLLSKVSDCFHSLFRLVFAVVLTHSSFADARGLFERVSAHTFSPHSSDNPSHPLHHFSAFVIESFLEPRIFSLLTGCFHHVVWRLDQAQSTSSRALKVLLDCKFGMRAFCSFYLSLYPERRSEFVSDFVSFFECRPASGIGLSFVNEILRCASFLIKRLRIQNYIQFYHDIKDESVELECTRD